MTPNDQPDYPSLETLWQLSDPRIRRIEIRNYRSINETTFDVMPFTVLAGANGAGKSNVVDAFRFVSEALTLGLYAALERRAGIQAVRHRVPSRGGRQRTVELKFLVDFAGGISAEYGIRLISGARGAYRVGEEILEMTTPVGYQFGLLHLRNGEVVRKPILLVEEGVHREDDLSDLFLPRLVNVGRENLALPIVGTSPGIDAVFRALREMRAYSIVPDLLREPQDSDEGYILRANGRNAPSVWRALGPEDKAELIALLGHAVPGIEDVRTRRYGRKQGFEFLQETGAGRLSFEAHQMSDGTLRLFGILLALLQPRRSTIIAVEEPEASLHIAALEALVETMKSRVGPGEVLLTTHSPELIDIVSPDELRLVRREGGDTVVSEVAPHSKKVVREALFTLGELHRVGGLRAADESVSIPPES